MNLNLTRLANPAISILLVLIIICSSAKADTANRATCRYGTLDTISCGCTCSGLLILQGKECVCPTDHCTTDFWSWGSADQGDNCTCSCPSWATNWLNQGCSWYGGVADFTKCGCNCPAGKAFDYGVYQCKCKLTPDCSLTNKVFDDNSCTCVCDPANARLCTDSGGSVDSSCVCGGCQNGKILQGGACVCPAHNPPGANQNWNETICKTECVSGAYQEMGNACYLNDCFQDSVDCLASERLFNESSGSCSCPVVVL